MKYAATKSRNLQHKSEGIASTDLQQIFPAEKSVVWSRPKNLNVWFPAKYVGEHKQHRAWYNGILLFVE